MTVLDIQAVTALIYAHSALHYHIHGGERPSVLCRDSRAALEECVRQCFATMMLSLHPFIDEIELGDNSLLGCTLKSEYASLMSEKQFCRSLEAALSFYTLHLVTSGSDAVLSDNSLSRYREAIKSIVDTLEGADISSVRLEGYSI